MPELTGKEIALVLAWSLVTLFGVVIMVGGVVFAVIATASGPWYLAPLWIVFGAGAGFAVGGTIFRIGTEPLNEIFRSR